MAIAGRQAQITGFFDSDAGMWDAYYGRRDVFSRIHQLRQTLALTWLQGLDLAPSARVLEVGCGTGLMAVEMARRGHRVTALDPSPAMLARARENVRRAGAGDRLHLLQGDAIGLPVPDATFDVVVALGVVPWLPDPRPSVAEMVRALRPGGSILVNCDNRHRLAHYLDPKFSPLLSGLRTAVKRTLRREHTQANGASTVRHSRAEFDTMLAAAGALRRHALTFGFGPFTFMGHQIPERVGVALQGAMQSAGNAGWPPFKGSGAQYLVLATKGRI